MGVRIWALFHRIQLQGSDCADSATPRFRVAVLERCPQFPGLGVIGGDLPGAGYEAYEREIEIEISTEAKNIIIAQGFDAKYGARPLRRLIMKEIGDVLTEEILFGKLSKGGKVRIGRRRGKMTFSYPQ